MFRYALLLTAMLFAFGAPRSGAFSLLGPLDDRFMTIELSYGDSAGDIGGPMLLGEEYRWSKPVVTYGYDKTFLDYFGQDGVNAIEEAIALLNALPPASQMSADFSEFPLQGKGANFKAAALGVFDIKTTALGFILNSMGVGGSTRWVFTLRNRWVVNNVGNYITVMRNYDPVTWSPSAYVNGALWTYSIVQYGTNPDRWDASEISNDEFFGRARMPASAVFAAGGGSLPSAFPGEYFYALTRDDVAAIHYLYHPANVNVETLPAGATLTSVAAVGAGGGFGSGGFGAPPVLVGPGSGGPWSSPFGTNLINPGVVTNDPGTGVPGGGGGAVAPVSVAFRSGVDKVTFQRMDAAGNFGVWGAVTNRWVDTYFTNIANQIRVVRQGVELVVNAPDIVFGAGDAGLIQNTPALADIGQADNWVNNAALNSFTGAADNAGPGEITGMAFIFSSVGPWYLNTDTATFEGTATLHWGSYDGSSNDPILYPRRSSIEALEQSILGR